MMSDFISAWINFFSAKFNVALLFKLTFHYNYYAILKIKFHVKSIKNYLSKHSITSLCLL